MRAVNFFLAILSLAFVVVLTEYVEAVSPNDWPLPVFGLAVAFGICALVNLFSVIKSFNSKDNESK